MVQNLNNNLITAPELAELRKRLRNLETKDGQIFFVALFRSWCHNAVATFSLCLLAQAYEQAYNLLQIFAELEMTVNMLIQIDKLVQLLESPVFTCKPNFALKIPLHPSPSLTLSRQTCDCSSWNRNGSPTSTNACTAYSCFSLNHLPSLLSRIVSTAYPP